MEAELEEKLYKKYPKLFAERNLPMTQTCMCWGLECSNGWFNILERMCGLLQHHIKETRRSCAAIRRYNRALKQAIGGNDKNLRFYYSKRLGWENEKVDEFVKKDLEKQTFREEWRKPPTQLVFTQIKEKYGTLRVYYNGGDEYCGGIIAMAESMSAVTCEDCGVPGKIRGGGWIRTLCDGCEEKYKSRTFNNK
jgi:hypothetical protein